MFSHYQESRGHHAQSFLEKATTTLEICSHINQQIANNLESLPEKLCSEAFTKTFVNVSSRVLAYVLEFAIPGASIDPSDEDAAHLKEVSKVGHALLTLC